MQQTNERLLSGLIGQMQETNKLLVEVRDHAWHVRYHNWDMLKMARLQALGPDRVVAFRHQGQQPVKFYVPKAGLDYIQGFHVLHEEFWDLEILRYFEPFVTGKTILDIGANVGNHAIYWSMVGRAKKIMAFEPVSETFEILERNLQLNAIANVEPFKVALGEQKATGKVLSSAANRMMAEIANSPDGDIQVIALDDLNLKAADFAKIDVEGHTLPLIKGACQTLAALKPAVFVELYDHEKVQCETLLSDLGYSLVKALPNSNYLYLHRDRPFTGELER